MPAVRTLVATSLLALFLAPPLVGATEVGGGVTGSGMATDLQILARSSYSVRGGLSSETLACGICYVRLTISEGSFLVAQDGAVTQLPPGQFELREFHGVITITDQGLHRFFVQVEGVGRYNAL